jgi:hypothetical protein
MNIKIFVKKLVNVLNKATAQIETNVRAHVFNAGLLAGSQFATGQLSQGFPWSQTKF